MNSPVKKKFTSLKFIPLEESCLWDIPPVRTKIKHGIVKFLIIGLAISFVLSMSTVVIRGRHWVIANQNVAFAGAEQLQQGLEALAKNQYDSANNQFTAARQSFAQLATTTNKITNRIDGFLDQALYVGTAEKLIESGFLVSEIGQELVELLKSAGQLPKRFLMVNQAEGKGAEAFMTRLHDEKARLDRVRFQAITLQQNLTTINSRLLPSDIRKKLTFAQQKLEEILMALNQVNKTFKVALDLLGDDVPHHYLILLQNTNERRATGGFIGSLLFITMNDGVATQMEAKDVYEVDGQLMETVEAPPGINQVADQWYLRDANYSPDFPVSARQIIWFLEHSRGPSVDTVIAIDQNIATSLLGLTGPIRMGEWKVDADNFNRLFSYHIEAKLSGLGEPKKLLFDLIPKFKEKLSELNQLHEFAAVMRELSIKGNIQMYSTHPSVQRFSETLNLDGRLIAAEPGTDYLNVISTSIGGNKSDQYIQTHLGHGTFIGQNGHITNQLKITKKHTWNEQAFAETQKLIDKHGSGQLHTNTLRYILGQGENIDYMRVYVPKGSQLRGAHAGVTAYDEGEYTIFAFNITVQPGGEQSVTLNYELPFRLSMNPIDNYRFIVQRQAGVNSITLKKEVITAEGLSVVKEYPQTTSAFSPEPWVEMALNQNEVFIIAIQKNQ